VVGDGANSSWLQSAFQTAPDATILLVANMIPFPPRPVEGTRGLVFQGRVLKETNFVPVASISEVTTDHDNHTTSALSTLS
jgi:hypothetical protein